jgi:hypothetical protein
VSEREEHPRRSPNLPPHSELQLRLWRLVYEISEARGRGDKETARRLERERRGVFHQLQQSWDENAW